MIGMTASATSASCQFSISITMMIPASVMTSPMIETMPCVMKSFRASTSLVMRVMSRPTGFLSKKLKRQALQVPEDLVSQVVHDALPDVLHEVVHDVPHGEAQLSAATKMTKISVKPAGLCGVI